MNFAVPSKMARGKIYECLLLVDCAFKSIKGLNQEEIIQSISDALYFVPLSVATKFSHSPIGTIPKFDCPQCGSLLTLSGNVLPPTIIRIDESSSQEKYVIPLKALCSSSRTHFGGPVCLIIDFKSLNLRVVSSSFSIQARESRSRTGSANPSPAMLGRGGSASPSMAYNNNNLSPSIKNQSQQLIQKLAHLQSMSVDERIINHSNNNNGNHNINNNNNTTTTTTTTNTTSNNNNNNNGMFLNNKKTNNINNNTDAMILNTTNYNNNNNNHYYNNNNNYHNNVSTNNSNNNGDKYSNMINNNEDILMSPPTSTVIMPHPQYSMIKISPIQAPLPPSNGLIQSPITLSLPNTTPPSIFSPLPSSGYSSSSTSTSHNNNYYSASQMAVTKPYLVVTVLASGVPVLQDRLSAVTSDLSRKCAEFCSIHLFTVSEYSIRLIVSPDSRMITVITTTLNPAFAPLFISF
jgi:hypothetical protein